MKDDNIKLSFSPLVETWLSADFTSTETLSSAGFKRLVEKEFQGAKMVQMLSERNARIEDKGDVRTEVVTENRAAGIVIDCETQLPMQIVLKNGRVECKVLGDYPAWDSFIKIARESLLKCTQNMGRVSFNKLSVRSVNKIHFMQGEKNFSNVLRMLPLDPDDGLNGVCADMFYRDTQYYPAYRAYATVVRAYQRQPDADKTDTPIFLDIDVFKMRNQGEELLLDDDTLAGIHDLKNRIFVGAITEKQLGYYK